MYVETGLRPVSTAFAIIIFKYILNMKKRIAIPLENGILCTHFGH